MSRFKLFWCRLYFRGRYVFDDVLYMVGGDFVFMFFLCFLFYLCLCSCFTLCYIGYDLYYEIIHGICLLFYVFVKSRILFWFTCIFHTYVCVLFSVSRIYRLIHSKLLSTFATDK